MQDNTLGDSFETNNNNIFVVILQVESRKNNILFFIELKSGREYCVHKTLHMIMHRYETSYREKESKEFV